MVHTIALGYDILEAVGAWFVAINRIIGTVFLD